MRRMKSKIGDIFVVKIDTRTKKFFQYVANDLTQLNSDVIRAFKKQYLVLDNPSLSDIVKDEIDFFAHCVTETGLSLNRWTIVGNSSDLGGLDMLFRDSEDYSRPEITVSKKWWVWRINEDQRRVGVLKGESRNSEIGIVVRPDSIVHRMRTGEYDFAYPRVE